MKIVIERAALLRSLGHIQSVVERRNTIPILSNVLLKAENGELTLTATDMDLEVNETVAADIVVAGETTAPAHTLHDIVRKLPDGAQVELDCSSDANTLMLRAGRSNFRLGCLPTGDFPQMTGGDFSHHFSLPAADLRLLIDKTKFAISTEETRYYLNGIYLHTTQDKAPNGEDVPGPMVMRAVATDGHRLARVQIGCPEGADGMPGIIIPRKTVLEVYKLLDGAADDVNMSLSATKIRVAVDGIVVTSKLIDGTFPDYERVIPQGNDKLMEVDSKIFASAVDRVATISTEKSRAVKMSLDAGNITLSATSAEAGSAMEELDVDYDEGSMQIGFNSRYLLDITQQISGEKAHFLLSDAASPTIIQDGADKKALYVLMPMRV